MKPASLEEAPQPASSGETKAAQPLPHVTREDRLTSSHAREQAAAAQETYREAACSMERMFEELEAGIVPRPDTLRIVVTNVLSRVLDDGASMLSLLSLQKMKRFDRTLASHALDVCTLSLIVAHDYGVAEGDLEALGTGALLHDIGYIRLPRNLYRRSHDLTEQERTMMQQHPALGLAILRDAQEDRDAVVRIVVEHHECSNGSGFPHKLKGDSLSILAQLVGLVDVYDGMVSRRGGRPAMLPHDAIRQLFRLGDDGTVCKGFDPNHDRQSRRVSDRQSGPDEHRRTGGGRGDESPAAAQAGRESDHWTAGGILSYADSRRSWSSGSRGVGANHHEGAGSPS